MFFVIFEEILLNMSRKNEHLMAYASNIDHDHAPQNLGFDLWHPVNYCL